MLVKELIKILETIPEDQKELELCVVFDAGYGACSVYSWRVDLKYGQFVLVGD